MNESPEYDEHAGPNGAEAEANSPEADVPAPDVSDADKRAKKLAKAAAKAAKKQAAAEAKAHAAELAEQAVAEAKAHAAEAAEETPTESNASLAHRNLEAAEKKVRLETWRTVFAALGTLVGLGTLALMLQNGC